MTSCLVAINKNRDMCFDMKNGKKTYFSGEITVNDCRNVWRGLKSIRLFFFFFTYLKSFMQRIIQKRVLYNLRNYKTYFRLPCNVSNSHGYMEELEHII